MTVAKGQGKKKLIIGVARRLAELLWRLIRKGADYEIRKFAGPSIGWGYSNRGISELNSFVGD
jgi:hypothetical protein